MCVGSLFLGGRCCCCSMTSVTLKNVEWICTNPGASVRGEGRHHRSMARNGEIDLIDLVGRVVKRVVFSLVARQNSDGEARRSIIRNTKMITLSEGKIGENASASSKKPRVMFVFFACSSFE